MGLIEGPLIQLAPVKSSVFSHVGYDTPASELHIRLHSGARHAFGNFSPSDWAMLWNAESRGSHFALHVKGKHPERRVTE